MAPTINREKEIRGNITIMTLSGFAAQKQGLLFTLMAAELPFSQRLESRLKKVR
jgi:hypothetical protein